MNKHLPQVQELVLVLDDQEDEDDEAELRRVLEGLSLAGLLGTLSFNVMRGTH